MTAPIRRSPPPARPGVARNRRRSQRATSTSSAGLNPVQREAVTAPDGPILVVAGAGSGKTRLLTHRVAYLIAERRRLAVRAPRDHVHQQGRGRDEGARRRRSSVRSRSACGCRRSTPRARGSCAARPPLLGYRSSFSIYDQADAVAPRRLRAPRPQPRPEALPAPPAARRDLGDEERARRAGARRVANALTPPEKRIAEIYVEYQRRLAEASAADFDDLLLLVVRLFREHPDALARWRHRFGHVLVDEFQDTNLAQWELVRLLAEEHRNVMVVGDADQSVYRFRGADYRNLLRFEEMFPDASIIVLDQNYRSTQSILDAANAVIANNAARRPKHLWTEQIGGELIIRYHAEDEHDEASFVVARDRPAHRHEGHRFGDIAVFYRTNAQSRVVEESLVRAGIPYRIVGGMKFYDRREVKDALAYLRALVNPDDEVSWKRIVNTPKRGVGDTSVRKIDVVRAGRGLTFREALRDGRGRGRHRQGARRHPRPARRDRRSSRARPTRGVAATLEAVLDRTGYLAELEAERTIEAAGPHREPAGARRRRARVRRRSSTPAT